MFSARQEPIRAGVLRRTIKKLKNIFAFSGSGPHTEDGPDPPRLSPAPQARPASRNVHGAAHACGESITLWVLYCQFRRTIPSHRNPRNSRVLAALHHWESGL